jgi:hypothetical protein
VKTALPEVARAAEAEMHGARSRCGCAGGSRETLHVMGDGDEVDVVVEEAVALQGDAVVGQELGQQLEVEEAAGGAEEALF